MPTQRVRRLHHAVFIVLVAGAAACSGDEATDVLGRSDDQLIAELSARIADRDTWPQPDAWSGRGWVSAGSPHGTWVEIHIDEAAADLLGDDTLPWGTVLTKEHFDAENGPPSGVLNAMWKLRGLDPDGNHWFWVQWRDGEVHAAGDSLDACSSCHSSGADHVRSAVDDPGTPRP